jgi:hypothetical protein
MVAPDNVPYHSELRWSIRHVWFIEAQHDPRSQISLQRGRNRVGEAAGRLPLPLPD